MKTAGSQSLALYLDACYASPPVVSVYECAVDGLGALHVGLEEVRPKFELGVLVKPSVFAFCLRLMQLSVDGLDSEKHEHGLEVRGAL